MSKGCQEPGTATSSEATAKILSFHNEETMTSTRLFLLEGNRLKVFDSQLNSVAPVRLSFCSPLIPGEWIEVRHSHVSLCTSRLQIPSGHMFWSFLVPWYPKKVVISRYHVSGLRVPVRCLAGLRINVAATHGAALHLGIAGCVTGGFSQFKQIHMGVS